MASTMRELIDLRNRRRDYLPEGRPLDEYSDAQRVEMTKDVANPDTRNTPFGGTFVRNPDGSLSSRAPSPEVQDRKDRAWQAVDESVQSHGAAATLEGPLYRNAMMASAEAYGMDPSQYRDPLVLQDADATRDFDIMYGDVERQVDRRDAIEEKYMPVPAQLGKDGKPVAWRFAPRPKFREKMERQDQGIRSQQLFRNILDKHGRYVGQEMREELRAMADAGDFAGLRDAKQKLLADQRGNAAKNVADNWENINLTRKLNNPDTALGLVLRSTQGVAPHDRAALYTVLGWEPAATRETQAGIAQDAYNSQMAMASQQGGAAGENPDDATVAGQTDRHFAIIDRMIDRGGRNGINRAVAATANFHKQATGLDPKAAQERAQQEVADILIRRGGIYASAPLARTRIASKARGSLDQFVEWAATIGWSPEYAQSEYERLRGRSRPASTASPPAAAGASASDFPARGDM